ncbi:unnamed protein product [Urochloa humidicola]
MLNLYPRHQLQLHASSINENDAVDADDGYSAIYGYGIAVVCVTIFVFCVLVSTVTVWKALASAALVAVLLGATGYFAPRRWFRPSGRRGEGAGAEFAVVTVTASGARRGYPCALVDAPPAFAFQCPSLEAGGGGGEAAAAEAAAGCVVCSVCLEDVRGGEMVRQVQGVQARLPLGVH